jgi:hypothetical protein
VICELPAEYKSKYEVNTAMICEFAAEIPLHYVKNTMAQKVKILPRNVNFLQKACRFM